MVFFEAALLLLLLLLLLPHRISLIRSAVKPATTEINILPLRPWRMPFPSRILTRSEGLHASRITSALSTAFAFSFVTTATKER